MGSVLLRNISLSGSAKDVLIHEGRISRIEQAGSASSWNLAGDIEIMNCSGKVAIPGFINMHSHSPMSLMRGVGEDMVFKDWIQRIWEIEKNVDEDFVYWGTKVACVEMIRTGTTCFNDQYWFHEASYRAAKDMGLRIATGYDILEYLGESQNPRIKDECIESTGRCLSEWGDEAIYVLNFHAIYTVSESIMKWAGEYAREKGLKLHIHLSETRKEVEDCKRMHKGLTPVEYLDSIGVLGPNILAAHTLWLTDRDIEILAARKVNCIHNINSNTKLASGYRFRYDELRDAGVNICLGTDGCASSNNLDMLEAMKTSALFQKAWRDDPSAMPLDELMDAATINGAKALNLDSGRLEEGAIADISIIDTDNSFFLSPAPFMSNLIYSAHSDCIDSVMCAGKFLMRHREIEGEKEIYAQARKAIQKIS